MVFDGTGAHEASMTSSSVHPFGWLVVVGKPSLSCKDLVPLGRLVHRDLLLYRIYPF